MMNQPVGIFDSGFGGLTAVSELQRVLPGESILFFGDNARAPYGAKTREEIRQCTANIVDYLIRCGSKALLAACGTISLNAGDIVKYCSLPTCNVLNPSISYISSLPCDAPLGIIATAASIRSHGYEDALAAIGYHREIISVPCPDFVTLIEAGIPWHDSRVSDAVARYLKPIKEAGASALLLGCTHYGIIEPAIRSYLGDTVEIISASSCGAHFLAESLGNDISSMPGKTVFCTSGDPAEFRKTASVILGYDIGEVFSVPSWIDPPNLSFLFEE